MAEALIIISGVLSVVAAVGSVYDATEDEMGLLPDFKKAVALLPLLSSLLDGMEKYVNEETGDTNIAALTPALKSCRTKVAQLHQILENVVPVEGESWTRRKFKAFRAIGRGGRVKKLVEGLLKDLQLIAAKFPEDVSLIEQKNLTKAIEEVSKLKSSLPDFFEETSISAHYGSAAEDVDTGFGSQYNNHITGRQNNDPDQQCIDTNRVDSLTRITFGDRYYHFQAGNVTLTMSLPADFHHLPGKERSEASPSSGPKMRISRDGTKLEMKKRTESLWLRPLSWTEQKPLEKGKSPSNVVTGDYTLSITDGLSVYTKGYPYRLSTLLKLVFPVRATVHTVPPVPPGQSRVRWICTCGEELYDDFTEVIEGSLIGLQERLRNQPRAESSTKVPSTAAKIFQSVREFANSITPMLQRTVSQMTSLVRRPNGLPLHKDNDAGQAAQVQQPPGTSSAEHFPIILLCISTGSNSTWLFQELLQNVHDDSRFFHFLRSQYSKHRRRPSWLSLKGVSKVSLTRFRVDENHFADVHHHDSLCSNNCSCLPPVEKVQAKEYRCSPAPEIDLGYFPPIGANALTHYFQRPHAFNTAQKTIFNQVPKRGQGVLSIGADEWQLGWGIHIAEGWHWRWIYFIIVVPLLLGGFIFGITWSVTKGDIQSAFAIAASWMALAPVLLGYIAVRDLD